MHCQSKCCSVAVVQSPICIRMLFYLEMLFIVFSILHNWGEDTTSNVSTAYGTVPRSGIWDPFWGDQTHQIGGPDTLGWPSSVLSCENFWHACQSDVDWGEVRGVWDGMWILLYIIQVGRRLAEKKLIESRFQRAFDKMNRFNRLRATSEVWSVFEFCEIEIG